MSRIQSKSPFMAAIAVIVIAAVVIIAIQFISSPDSESQGNLNGNEAEVQQPDNNGEQDVPPADEQDVPAGDETPEPEEEPAKPVVPSVQHDIPSVAETYADYFPIGAAIEPKHMTGLTAELLKKHVNMLVAENIMKPDAMQPTEGNFRWEQADRMVEFAKENGMELRFHTLVWHNQVPRWFFRDEDGNPMTEETDPVKQEANKKLLLQRLDTHVRTIVERYKDDIKYWDVVNEVIEPGDPGGIRNSDWYKITGTDFIETAFRAAREAGGPDIKLYINDYGTEDVRKMNRMYDLVKEMLDRGVPIDGVGHQMHISIPWPPVKSITDTLQKFAELGLDNQITEMDMSLYAWNDRRDYGDDIPEDVLKKQGERYRDIFNALKENKDILSAVVFWGIADNHTWLSGFPITRTEAPLLFDKNFQAKPAYWGVVDPSKLD